jgi:VanZ family protein
MVHKIAALAAWALLAFIAHATISPIQDRPGLATSPGLEHVAAFALLGALFCFAYPKRIILVFVVVLGSALLLEYAQLLTPERHGRLADAIEKAFGGMVGIIVGRAMLHCKGMVRWVKNKPQQ